jgi:DNA-binding XRE family transcriptional regulator
MLLVSEAVGLYHNNVRVKQKGYRIMINENIKYFRKSKGITQEEMAVKLNVVRQTVSKWENADCLVLSS